VQFTRIIAFMRQQSALRKSVLVLPEAPILYAFSGTDSPTRWYQTVPHAQPRGPRKIRQTSGG